MKNVTAYLLKGLRISFFRDADSRLYDMQWISQIKRVKIFLIAIAILIVISSLLIAHFLVRDLSKEEYNKMAIWAEAMKALNRADDSTDLNLVLKVLNENNTIPVVVLDNNGNVLTFRNINVKEKSEKEIASYIKDRARQMRDKGNTMRISLSVDSTKTSANVSDYMEICYDQSLILHRLAYYPYVQLCVVLIFVLIAILALLSSKKAEQNKVWVGLSKETAHQLGTPISSLMAWVEILKETYPRESLFSELEKDVNRLQLVAERFSKIGSIPELSLENINDLIKRVVEYMSFRTSNHIKVQYDLPEKDVYARINSALFEWVIENLCKNSIDAMVKEGTITIALHEEQMNVSIEVKDTGKGISKAQFKSVFVPGYTTKKRGWGLGLSLAKRIVEEYHRGRIYVKSSEIGKGTIFRIELKKQVNNTTFIKKH